jgi:CheY-like chemotaxis protein
MTKILLVEDDDNLRGIYGDRLMAEGYEIASARDGEEALAMAVSEKPDLIISDVMMPKISGFDMLDILRSTKETKDTKVIMMTALSQKEDQERGEALGANRYLVKSQVTLEDVVRVAAEVLSEEKGSASSGPATNTPADNPAVAAPAVPTSSPATPVVDTSPTTPSAPTPIKEDLPKSDDDATKSVATAVSSDSVAASAESSDDEKSEVDEQIKKFASKADEVAAQPPVESAPQKNNEDKPIDEHAGDTGTDIKSSSIGSKRTLNPINDPRANKPDINKLLEKEIANEIDNETVAGSGEEPKSDGSINPNDIAL